MHEALQGGAKPNSSDEEVVEKFLDEKVQGEGQRSKRWKRFI